MFPRNYDLYDVRRPLMAYQASQKATEIDVDGVAVRLIPDKVSFPNWVQGGTKGQVMGTTLRAVAGGPLSGAAGSADPSQRFPDGIAGRRSAKLGPRNILTITPAGDLSVGRTADALKVTHPSAIAWAAQMGTVTFHPWQVAARTPNTPTNCGRPGPATGHRISPRPGGSPSRAQAAVGRTRSGGLPERPLAVRVSMFLRIRPGLGLRRGAPGGHRAGP